MGLSDRQSSSKLWKISISAKAEGMITAELQLASPGRIQNKGFLSSFLARMKRGSTIRQHNERAICDASLRVRARLFFVKAKVAAGRLRELHVLSRQGTLLHFRSCGKSSPTPAPAFFPFFKGCSPSSPSERVPSFLSRFLLPKRKRKESLLVCGAGVGAFALFLLHHASSWATHFPAFALNVGSQFIGLFAKFVHGKCNSAGFKGAACFWQGIRGALSLFQMLTSFVRSIFGGNQLVNTAFFAVLIGVLLTGKAGKLQDLLDSKTRGGARLLKARMAMKLLLVMQLIKRLWAHINVKQACLFVVLLAFFASAVSGLSELS